MFRIFTEILTNFLETPWSGRLKRTQKKVSQVETYQLNSDSVIIVNRGDDGDLRAGSDRRWRHVKMTRNARVFFCCLFHFGTGPPTFRSLRKSIFRPAGPYSEVCQTRSPRHSL